MTNVLSSCSSNHHLRANLNRTETLLLFIHSPCAKFIGAAACGAQGKPGRDKRTPAIHSKRSKCPGPLDSALQTCGIPTEREMESMRTYCREPVPSLRKVGVDGDAGTSPPTRGDSTYTARTQRSETVRRRGCHLNSNAAGVETGIRDGTRQATRMRSRARIRRGRQAQTLPVMARSRWRRCGRREGAVSAGDTRRSESASAESRDRPNCSRAGRVDLGGVRPGCGTAHLRGVPGRGVDQERRRGASEGREAFEVERRDKRRMSESRQSPFERPQKPDFPSLKNLKSDKGWWPVTDGFLRAIGIAVTSANMLQILFEFRSQGPQKPENRTRFGKFWPKKPEFRTRKWPILDFKNLKFRTTLWWSFPGPQIGQRGLEVVLVVRGREDVAGRATIDSGGCFSHSTRYTAVDDGKHRWCSLLLFASEEDDVYARLSANIVAKRIAANTKSTDASYVDLTPDARHFFVVGNHAF
ncbi:hypothetical protein B0H16DRAFT_1468563 [Mycena metata]|uniref:Uncharacterized protein n=1 Tax=Mycena metata TaxID=1033252 RepID=A0AAD7MVG9_9AGAR|nr:hypothetical protein B0H16DRAFT_1468563 [Mycena metata]